MKGLPQGCHSVGSKVSNIHTRQTGQIVRIVSLSDLFQEAPDHLKKDTVAYVVALHEPRSGVREAIWFESELLKTDRQEGSVTSPTD